MTCNHISVNHKEMDPEAIYTCPMHPEIEQVGPGNCPICGMALEPQGVSLNEDRTEYLSMRLRFALCSILSFPILLLVMGEHFFWRTCLSLHFATIQYLDSIYLGNSSHALGGISILSAWLAICLNYESEYVYPDFYGHRGCVYL